MYKKYYLPNQIQYLLCLTLFTVDLSQHQSIRHISIINNIASEGYIHIYIFVLRTYNALTQCNVGESIIIIFFLYIKNSEKNFLIY